MYSQLFKQRLVSRIETKSPAKDFFDRIKSKLFVEKSQHHEESQNVGEDDDGANANGDSLKVFDDLAFIVNEFSKTKEKISSQSQSSNQQTSFSLPPLGSIITNTVNNNNHHNNNNNNSQQHEAFINEFTALYFSFINNNNTHNIQKQYGLPSLDSLLMSSNNNKDYLGLFIKHANLLLDSFQQHFENTSANDAAASVFPPSSNKQHQILVDFAVFLKQTGLASGDPRIPAECWAQTLEARMQAKVEAMFDPFDLSEEQYPNLMKWKRRVVEPFIKTLLLCAPSKQQQQQQQYNSKAPPSFLCANQLQQTGPSPFSSATTHNNSSVDHADQWLSYCTEHLCAAAARTRLNTIFDDVVDFPDSRPHLADIASCIAQQPALLHDVARATKAALTARLQHAGASTSNVLFLLSQTCRALCVIKPGKAAGEALIRQVCDTTIRHLRARRDAVAAVVSAITSSNSGGNNAWAMAAAGAGDGKSGALGADAAISGAASTNSSNNSDGPDILRMLLSVLTVPVVVKEYCRALSHRLLTRKPHQIDPDNEKEILERLKVLLGEDALSSSAAVMLKDFETTRRWIKSCGFTPSSTNNNAASSTCDNNNTASGSVGHDAALAGASDENNAPPPSAAATATSAKRNLIEGTTSAIVSAPCWPDSVADGPFNTTITTTISSSSDNNQNDKCLKLHPTLEDYNKRVRDQYHKWKQNQSLVLLPHHGFVDLSVTQQMPNADATTSALQQSIKKSFRLNLVAASVVLYLSSSSSSSSTKMIMKELSDKLNTTIALLVQHIQEYSPQLFVIKMPVSTMSSSSSSSPTLDNATIELQQVALSNRALMDQEDSAKGNGNDDDGDGRGGNPSASSLLHASLGPALPAGLSQGAVDMLQNMLQMMIRNGGPKTAGQVENAARVVGMFSGSSNDMRDVLSYFLQKNVICTDGSGTYKLPASE